MYALTLIDKARQRFKSDSKIAQAIGISPQMLHRVTSGQAKLPPERAAILADLIGEDATYAMKKVALENADGDLFARLQKAFRVAAGVAGAVVLAGMAAAPSPSSAGTIRTDRDLRAYVTECDIARDIHCRVSA